MRNRLFTAPSRFSYSSCHPAQLLFNMFGVDLMPNYIDKVISPSEQLQGTWTEHDTDVSRIKPPIPKPRRRRAGIVFVAVDTAAAFDSYQTRLPYQREMVIIDDFDLDPRKNDANPVGIDGADWEDFTCAVILDQSCFQVAVHALTQVI